MKGMNTRSSSLDGLAQLGSGCCHRSVYFRLGNGQLIKLHAVKFRRCRQHRRVPTLPHLTDDRRHVSGE